MSIFKFRSPYEQFAEFVTQRGRYIRNRAVERFLKMVREAAKKRYTCWSPNMDLWRAQRGCVWTVPHGPKNGFCTIQIPIPYGPDRMKPRREDAVEGRVNPRGISFLYLATDCHTAIGEVRPWIEPYVSVGLFRVCRELRLVSCVTDYDRLCKEKDETSPVKNEAAAWLDIAFAFAKPIDLTDSSADYVPTQIIAELFKKLKFDGLVYSSRFGAGHNIALFDLHAADMVDCRVFEVKNIRFDFEEVS